jgi:predicted RNase H-like HicB family nuclease
VKARDPAVDLDREVDGRWIAEVPAIPGAIVYGSSPEQAISTVRRLAADVIEDRRVHGEPLPDLRPGAGC